MQRGKTRGETVRLLEGTGHRMLSLMAAQEGIGHMLFHQAPSHDNPPPSDAPRERALDAEFVC